jgi:hypothetical protein
LDEQPTATMASNARATRDFMVKLYLLGFSLVSRP